MIISRSAPGDSVHTEYNKLNLTSKAA